MSRGANTAASVAVAPRAQTRARRGGDLDDLGVKIRSVLTDDLLKPEYRDNPRPYAGHCYVASEVYYHLAGGKAAGYKAMGMEHEGSQHWWLENKDGQVVDLTAEQFKTPVPYHKGKGRGFLTKDPSKRAQTIIQRLDTSA